MKILSLILMAGLLTASPSLAKGKEKKRKKAKTEQKAAQPADTTKAEPKPSVDRDGLFRVQKFGED